MSNEVPRGEPSFPRRFRSSSRRWALRCLAALALLLVAGSVWAGTYLDRATLVIRGAGEEAEYLRHRLSNRELARIVHRLSQTRLEATRTTEVPKEVSLAHPHLLLMLENYERAADAAVGGQPERFLIYQGRARDEEQIFRSILQQLGFPLAPAKRRR
jgi:hypothetical protein